MLSRDIEMSFYTKGNNILNEKGHIVVLKGVSRTGLEYDYVDLNAMIPETIDFDIQMMKTWGFNCIRFPLRDRFWLNDTEYKKKIKYWVEQTLKNDMFVILDLHTQKDHYGLDDFMFRSGGALAMWVDIAKTYKDNPFIFFEIFNEPHNISPLVWWEGNKDYYGYKEILKEIRKYAQNLCFIGGLDYAYQFNFIKQNQTLLADIKTFPNLVMSVHPYGYKGTPVNMGTSTAQIPTTLITNPQNYTGDCHLGITTPSVPPSQYGWDESFGFLIKENLFPVVATEWGLDRPDNCIQGGWYNVQVLEYMNSLNMSTIAWAWVQDRLDYPSLLDNDFQPTGKGNKDTVGPACSGSLNNFYQGPGVLVMQDLKNFHNQRRVLWTTRMPEEDDINNPFFRNFALLFFILMCAFNIIYLFPYHHNHPPKEKEPEIHKVVSNTKLSHTIRIRSSQSFPQLK